MVKGFVSQKQREFMERNHPELVPEMLKNTSNVVDLPDRSNLNKSLHKEPFKEGEMFKPKKSGKGIFG